MLLFNGSPITLTGLAEGRKYIIPKGHTLELESTFRGARLLDQLAAAGLRELRHGDDKEVIAEECRAAFMEKTEKDIEEFNAAYSAQKQQGLRRPSPSADFKKVVEIYQELGGTMSLSGVSAAAASASDDDEEDDEDTQTGNVIRTRRAVAAKKPVKKG